MLTRILPVVQLCLSILPFLVYTASLALVLDLCISNGFNDSCYFVVSFTAGLTVNAAIILIESIVVIHQFTMAKRSGQFNKYSIKPLIVIAVLASILGLLDFASAWTSEEVNFLGMLDDVVWGYVAAGIYQLLMTILAIKIMIDVRSVKMTVDYQPLVDMGVVPGKN